MWYWNDPNVKFSDATYFFDGSQLLPIPRISNGVRRYLALPLPHIAPPALTVPTPALSAAAASASEIDLTASYTGPPGVLTYTYQIGTSITGPWTTLAVQSGSTYAVTGLGSATQFYFQVNVQTSEALSRTSAWSTVASATTQTAATVPGQVTGVTLTPSTTSMRVSYAAMPTTTTYLIYRVAGGVNTLVGGDGTLSWTDPGLTASTSYTYVVVAHNAVGSGTASASHTASTLALPTSAKKWNPGYYPMTGNVNAAPAPYGNDRDTAYIEMLANDFSATLGFADFNTWDDLETAQGTYVLDGLLAKFNLILKNQPNGRYCCGIAAYKNFTSTVPNLATLNVNGSGTPKYILNNPGTYGSGPTNGSVTASQGGYGLSSYQTASGQYQFCNAALWNVNVMNRWIALWQFIASAPCVTSFGPYAGVTGYTWDTHPQTELFYNYGPSDLNMLGSPINPAGYNSASWQTQQQRWLAAVGTAFAKTSVAFMPGYGANGPGGNQQPSAQQTLMTAMIAANVDLSCTDAYGSGQGPDFADNLTWAQNLLIGNSYSGSVWISGGGTDQRKLFGQSPTIQTLDYTRNLQSGVSKDTQGAVDSCIKTTLNVLGANRVLLAMVSNDDFNISDYPGYVLPAIKANPFPTANKALPASYHV